MKVLMTVAMVLITRCTAFVGLGGYVVDPLETNNGGDTGNDSGSG